MQVNDRNKRWELHDERLTEKYRVKLFIHVGEIKILSNIFKKFQQVYEGETPQSVPLTVEEIELMKSFAEDLEKIN